MGRKVTVIISILAIMISSNAFAASYGIMGGEGLQVAGDFWFTVRALDRYNSPNRNFHGDDPFNAIRVRTFLVKQWNPETAMNIEFLWDVKAVPRVNGAYLTFRNIWGPMGAKVGMIPSPFGNYGTRSTYFNINPLIGVPAMWHYKTPLNGNGSQQNSAFFTGSRAKARWNKGQPLAYDACWDYGSEFFYEKGIWEGAVALTLGTLGSMAASDDNAIQEVVRLGMNPKEGLRYGISVSQGAWLRPDSLLVLPDERSSYNQTAAGYYFENTFSLWQFYSEGIWTKWEMPFVHEGALSNTSAYLESRYNFTPGWYVAGRYDIFTYNEISTTNDGLGPNEKWGYDFNRFEAAIGYRPIREGLIRLDYQGTFFADAGQDPFHLLALQFGYAF